MRGIFNHAGLTHRISPARRDTGLLPGSAVPERALDPLLNGLSMRYRLVGGGAALEDAPPKGPADTRWQ